MKWNFGRFCPFFLLLGFVYSVIFTSAADAQVNYAEPDSLSQMVVDSILPTYSTKPQYTHPFELGKASEVPKLNQLVQLIPINSPSFISENKDSFIIKRTFEKERQKAKFYFYYIFLGFLVGIFVLLKVDQNYLPNQIKATLNARFAKEYFRDEYQLFERNNLISLLIAITSISLILLAIINQSISNLPVNTFYYVFSMVAVFMLIRGLIMKILLLLGDKREDFEFISFHFFLFIKVFGLLFIPIVMIVYFNGLLPSTLIIQVSMFILILFVVILLIKQFQIALQKGFSNTFHFVLYFCCVELIPALILSKILFDVEQ